MLDEDKMSTLAALVDDLFRASVLENAEQIIINTPDGERGESVSLAKGIIAYEQKTVLLERDHNETVEIIADTLMRQFNDVVKNSHDAKARFDVIRNAVDNDNAVSPAQVKALGVCLDALMSRIVTLATMTLETGIERVSRRRAVDNRADVVSKLSEYIETGESND